MCDFNSNLQSQCISYQLILYLVTTCYMWPYFNVPLHAQIRQVWLYVLLSITGIVFNIYLHMISKLYFFFCIMREALVYFSLTVQHHKIILQCELFFNSKFYENYYLLCCKHFFYLYDRQPFQIWVIRFIQRIKVLVLKLTRAC